MSKHDLRFPFKVCYRGILYIERAPANVIIDTLGVWHEMQHETRAWLRSSDNDSTGFWPPGSLHTLGADGHI